MSLNRVRRNLFHEAYCEIIGRQVPYEEVWAGPEIVGEGVRNDV